METETLLTRTRKYITPAGETLSIPEGFQFTNSDPSLRALELKTYHMALRMARGELAPEIGLPK